MLLLTAERTLPLVVLCLFLGMFDDALSTTVDCIALNDGSSGKEVSGDS